MQIVICDDNREDLTNLEKLLLEYNTYCPDIRFEIEKFLDASILLNKIQKDKLADIYILDIIMSNISGIDLGSQIRKMNSKSIIIYVTTSDGFAMDAYDIHAIRYLLKPIQKNDFFEAMDYALSSYMDIKSEAVFLVKTKEGLVSTPYSKIEYIENSARKLEIHLAGGEKITSIFIRKSFDEEIKELINERSFIRVHKSFLVNLRYVKKLTRNDIIMDSGINIPISRKSIPDVKKEYLLFVSEQYK